MANLSDIRLKKIHNNSVDDSVAFSKQGGKKSQEIQEIMKKKLAKLEQQINSELEQVQSKKKQLQMSLITILR